MNIGIVAVRYAKALFAFAEENQELEKVYTELLTIIDSYMKVDALQSTLMNPVLSAKQKEKILLTACAGDGEVSKSMVRFVSLVVAQRRAQLMLFIAHSYIKLYRSRMNIVAARLIVPTTVSETLKEKIQQLLESKINCKMDFHIEENPEIMGGFILEYDTYRMDASLRNQLQKLLKGLK